MLRDISEITDEPMAHRHVPGDPDDTPILRALASSVDYLVTGDARLLALSPVEGIRSITLAEYLDVLQNHGSGLES